MTLLNHVDSLFDWNRRMLAPAGLGVSRALLPPTDLIVNNDEVIVVMDVPGLNADQLDIELTDDVLTITGQRPVPHMGGQQAGSWYRFERGHGTFRRTLQLPGGLDPDAISASILDGVLTLHIPRPEARKPRRIPITAGFSGSTLEQQTGRSAPDVRDAGAEAETPAQERELVGAGV